MVESFEMQEMEDDWLYSYARRHRSTGSYNGYQITKSVRRTVADLAHILGHIEHPLIFIKIQCQRI